MIFSFMDLSLIVLVTAFVLFGLYFGFIHTLGSLIGALLSIVGTGYAMPFILPWVSQYISLGPVARVILFVVVFLVLSRLIGFLFWILEKTIGLAAKLPFLSSIDHILGLVLGLIEGVIVTGILIHVSEVYLPAGGFTAALAASNVAAWVSIMTAVVVAWLPF